MTSADSEAPTKLKTEVSAEEADYLRGGKDPVVGSLLRSTSKYLNNPLFRDLFAQQGLRRDGAEVPSAYLIPDINRAFDEVADTPRLLAGLAAARQRHPEFAQWLDARFISDLKIDDVKDCAPGTLGRRVFEFMSNSGMTIDFMFLGEPKNDYEYINKRRIQTHDILHMVTGLDPSNVGEIALIVATMMSESVYFDDPEFVADLHRSGMFLVSTTLMRMACHYAPVLPVMVDGIARGHALGSKQKKPLFMINWEPYFDWKMEDIREEFSFQDGPPDGAWDWTVPLSRDPR